MKPVGPFARVQSCRAPSVTGSQHGTIPVTAETPDVDAQLLSLRTSRVTIERNPSARPCRDAGYCARCTGGRDRLGGDCNAG